MPDKALFHQKSTENNISVLLCMLYAGIQALISYVESLVRQDCLIEKGASRERFSLEEL